MLIYHGWAPVTADMTTSWTALVNEKEKELASLREHSLQELQTQVVS